MTSCLPSTGKSLDSLLPEPGLKPQSLSSRVSDVRPTHYEIFIKFIALTAESDVYCNVVMYLDELNISNFSLKLLLSISHTLLEDGEGAS